MDESLVTLPYERIVIAATVVGSQDSTVCPPGYRECFQNRALLPYIVTEDPTDSFCANCWMHYILLGH